ncbi:CDP-diacylglycerol--glycerol-3-phosphate 3-phosphatidyltransferase [Clostridium ganghwense]|uniref:CDP-diacylglycerol--glycerol-3-phosphate 3-phosphatidyltransferase n=1 Tax=Clostridium ganghwense TaxID=312089 RepID=A0ABT4CTX5_9CLOT|nr:CDP-diacylglycerol--glycerol-3-phosphate 3-phosphatidyltransferase [Clostridium ganghwense]MCY6372530.1 CDP-diacylglycerol--glycerol-3-phosphate 3-phosphatidyltransferase [Clostridium ganghwense]
MNLANKLTMLRILLVPVFLIFVALNTPLGTVTAIVVFILASLTDKLDGHIARSRNQITKFGKFMDPLADKLLVTSALVSLVEYQIVPTWMAMIIIAREFAVTGLRAVAASEGIVIAASWWGKLKTATQMVAIVFALIKLVYSPAYITYITYIILGAAVIITVISGVDYFVKNKKALSTEN